MFNIDQAISEWRKKMLQAGIQSPVPMEELESHLRDEIALQIKSGLSPQQAFETSVNSIGHAGELKNEFKKEENNFMSRKLVSLIGVFVLLMGVFMILPALGKHKQRNFAALSTGAKYFDIRWADDEKYGITLGAALFVCGAGTAFYGFNRRAA